MILTRRLLCSVILCCCALGPAGVQAQKLPRARPVSKAVAAEALKQFQHTYKDRNKRIRLAAVDGLTSLKHKQIARQLGRVLLRDRSWNVRAAAASRLGLQDPKWAMAPLQSAFAGKAGPRQDDVLLSVLEAWRRLGRSPPLKVLKKRWDQRSREVQRAIIQTSVLRRDLQTVKWLSTLVDSPVPLDVNSGSNPPAAYWKKKLIQWRFWVTHVQDALANLTDQDFESQREVKQWIKGGGKILPRKKKGTKRL